MPLNENHDKSLGYYGTIGGKNSWKSVQKFLASPTFPKESSFNLYVDPDSPTIPWRDIEGYISLRNAGGGGTDPALAVWKGGIKQFTFNVNDEIHAEYHIPHDYSVGTDLYLHFHWSHASASVSSGTVTWGAELTYAKGHNQSAFSANVTTTIAETAPTTQYQHMITEVQISVSGGASGKIDTDLLEVDGLIICRLYLSANTMNGSVKPFLHRADIHYQSTGIGTKNKSPNFYA